MKHGLGVLAIAVSALPWLCPGLAEAQPVQGFYVAAGAGMGFPFSTKVTPISPGFQGTYDFGQNPGFAGRLGAGYALGNGWRFEVEATLSQASINGIGGTGFPAAASGNVSHLGAMANAVFDMDVGSPWVYPYFGLGLGYQSTRLDSFTVMQTNRPLTFTSRGSAGGLAVQAILGASFPIPNMPGLSITAEYRLMDTLGGQKFNGGTVFGPLAVRGTAKFHNQFAQTAMFGLRYAFNTPAPAGLSK